MNAARHMTRLLNGSGLAVVVGALLAGGAAAEDSERHEENNAASTLVVAQTPETGDVDFSPNMMADAAEEAKRIEVRRERRARERAQRSSGPMFTPTTNYDITAVFGQGGGRWSSGQHTGLDFAAPTGTPVFSALAGKVVEAGWGGAYGNHVVVKHDGTKTLYAHLNSVGVKKGQSVLRGERIGSVGSTGNSSGPHLHFEVLRKGDPRDPQAFL
jgi:murein DD-endopeptidase MepM/ murein hydrolase activator NlpD